MAANLRFVFYLGWGKGSVEKSKDQKEGKMNQSSTKGTSLGKSMHKIGPATEDSAINHKPSSKLAAIGEGNRVLYRRPSLKPSLATGQCAYCAASPGHVVALSARPVPPPTPALSSWHVSGDQHTFLRLSWFRIVALVIVGEAHRRG